MYFFCYKRKKEAILNDNRRKKLNDFLAFLKVGNAIVHEIKYLL